MEPDHIEYFGRYVSLINSVWKSRADQLKFVYDQRYALDKFNLVVNQYFSDAITSFLHSSFIASTLASSESVEAAINWDPRMRIDPLKSWHGLDPKTLKLAKQKGLPIEKLLTPKDDLARSRVDFLTYRHKFGHGEIYLSTSPRTGPMIIESKERGGVTHMKLRLSPTPDWIALQQLKLAHAFLVALYG